MRNITQVAAVALSLGIVIAAVFAVNLVDPALRQVSSTQPNHVNVQVYCGQGRYLADHHCVSSCPPGFAPGYWFVLSPPTHFLGSPCMSSDDQPVSIYDLAGWQVSADEGKTVYTVISDVPMVKAPVADPVQRGYWQLRVSPMVLASLPTVSSIPSVRTEIATIGDQVATLRIIRIGADSVTGNQSTFYPLGWCCQTVTIHVGEDVGVGCEGLSEKLAWIDFPGQKVGFTVQIFPHDGCPICLSGDTVIDTPVGVVNVKDLTVGFMVWTMNQYGEKIIAPIIRVGMTRVPVTHEMVHLMLADGRQLYASPGHPTTDGRSLSQLRLGDAFDGSTVTLVQLIPYNQSYTYDLLPSGDTGFYWANGVLLASTLK